MITTEVVVNYVILTVEDRTGTRTTPQYCSDTLEKILP